MTKQIDIKTLSEGSQKSFKVLYDLFSEKIYNTALSYCQNQQDAEEITQDVFTSVFKNASNFKGDSTIDTWIYRITVNTSLNLIKKKKRQSFLKFNAFNKEKPDFEHPGIILENKENSKLLFKVIETLPDSQKTAFILSFIEALPRQEVADIMELSLKAVESLLQRAKSNLRKKLIKIYPNRRKNK